MQQSTSTGTWENVFKELDKSLYNSAKWSNGGAKTWRKKSWKNYRKTQYKPL